MNGAVFIFGTENFMKMPEYLIGVFAFFPGGFCEHGFQNMIALFHNSFLAVHNLEDSLIVPNFIPYLQKGFLHFLISDRL